MARPYGHLTRPLLLHLRRCFLGECTDSSCTCLEEGINANRRLLRLLGLPQRRVQVIDLADLVAETIHHLLKLTILVIAIQVLVGTTRAGIQMALLGGGGHLLCSI